MKNLFFVILSVFLFSACGDDEPAEVEWDCECEVTCDGETETIEETGECSTQDEAAAALDDVIDACEGELEDLCLYDYSCECECDPGPSC